MIVQAIALLDDLDKELNTYAMRVREWYGWHFPEMTKIVSDNIQYAKTVRASSIASTLLCCYPSQSLCTKTTAPSSRSQSLRLSPVLCYMASLAA